LRLPCRPTREATLQPNDAVVYIVDDDARVRAALTGLLESVGWKALGFGSAAEYLEFSRPDVPACVILDLDMPGMSGLELQRRLLEQEGPPILFLTGHGDIPASVKAMKAGAAEFFTKPFDEDQLLAAIEAAIAMNQRTRTEHAALHELRQRYEKLTPREREVLPFVISGFLNKQTAGELGTSEITIRIHRGQIMRKMAADSLAELVRMAARLGVVQLPPYTNR
jgi:FixJ family two-component response regulator